MRQTPHSKGRARHFRRRLALAGQAMHAASSPDLVGRCCRAAGFISKFSSMLNVRCSPAYLSLTWVPGPALTMVRTPGLALEWPTNAGGYHVQYATNLPSPVTCRMNRVFRMNFSLSLSLNPQLSTNDLQQLGHQRGILPPSHRTTSRPRGLPREAEPFTRHFSGCQPAVLKSLSASNGVNDFGGRSSTTPQISTTDGHG